MNDDMNRAASALRFVDSNCDRETWVRMGMAVKSEFGDTGFDLWNEWSESASNYDSADARATWKSMKAGGGITIGTLYREAKAAGWRDDGNHAKPTAEEIAERNRQAAERDALEARAIAQERAKTAKLAADAWKSASAITPDNLHPYLEKKQVSPPDTLREIDAGAAAAILGYTPKSGDEPLTGRLVVVPVRQDGVAGLSTLELIDGAGRKAALAGRGSKTGGYWAAQKLPEGTGEGLALIIGEGVATVLSAHAATGYPVVAALSSGNLGKVAALMRGRYPAAHIVILADLQKDTGEPDKHAAEAAQSIGAAMALPVFEGEREAGQTDFNDMMLAAGVDAVRAVIEAASADNQVASTNTEQTEQPAIEASGEPDAPEKAKAKKSNKHTRFIVNDKGVFFIGGDDEKSWICSPLYIKAKARDTKGNAWGRWLEWKDADGVTHKWAMPVSMLQQGDGAEFRQELAYQGLDIAPGRKAHNYLLEYLQTWHVDERVLCVDCLGWHGDAYVTPEATIGTDGEAVVFQNSQMIDPAFSVSGTIEEWRDTVARMAAGNSRMVFALSVAFAGALLKLAGVDSGGFHLRGGSSSGKSTAQYLAASVWGNPDTYPRKWRATSNGLEGLAQLHNDGILILDEIGQMNPQEVGETAYMLANGQGKSRASRTGAARKAAQWRLLFLSSGEESLSTLMAQAGKKTKAGQEIRMADIEADADAGMGAFEDIHEYQQASAFAENLLALARKYHGATGMEWLRRIVENRAALPEFIADGIQQFKEATAPAGADGQVMRVVRRFALVAVAGELATAYGLTGWQQGEAEAAAGKCFAAWLEGFGGAGNKENRAILSQVREFFGAHGASRFESVTATNEQRIINRAGFYRDEDGKRTFFVLPESFQKEICQGHDAKTAARALIKAGWIEPDRSGNATQNQRLPGIGQARCYVFNGRMWEGER